MTDMIYNSQILEPQLGPLLTSSILPRSSINTNAIQLFNSIRTTCYLSTRGPLAHSASLVFHPKHNAYTSSLSNSSCSSQLASKKPPCTPSKFSSSSSPPSSRSLPAIQSHSQPETATRSDHLPLIQSKSAAPPAASAAGDPVRREADVLDPYVTFPSSENVPRPISY
jgi:hypothetical protein